jgi:hypothetical protein
MKFKNFLMHRLIEIKKIQNQKNTLLILDFLTQSFILIDKEPIFTKNFSSLTRIIPNDYSLPFYSESLSYLLLQK